MAAIFFLDRLRSEKVERKSAFQKLMANRLRSDFDRKKQILMALGNLNATVCEEVNSEILGKDHIMLLFAGTGAAAGYSFGFAVISDVQDCSLTAEILVFDANTTALLSKTVGDCQIGEYTEKWLTSVFGKSLEIITPDEMPKASALL